MLFLYGVLTTAVGQESVDLTHKSIPYTPSKFHVREVAVTVDKNNYVPGTFLVLIYSNTSYMHHI